MIKQISFSGGGYINCKSVFYTSHDVLQHSMKFNFHTGINTLVGEIDTGIWGISYLLSMYNYDVNKKLFEISPKSSLCATVDGVETPLENLTDKCCYLDHKYYPLFSKRRKTVRKLIEAGIKKTHPDKTFEEICELFLLTPERLDRAVYQVGNERFRAMAAIGYAHGKEVFCFPWHSRKMFDYYTNNILWLLDILEKLNVIVILPVGEPIDKNSLN